MNGKTLFILIIISGAFAVIAVYSYKGFGLPIQNDPLTVRQFSAQNEREIRGGGPQYGK